MTKVSCLAGAIGVAFLSLPALALPILVKPDRGFADRIEPAAARKLYRGHGHAHLNPNGGYRVNRYGFGNYVGGSGGGFAGYPAGSGAAHVYKQRQEFKCQEVPETC